MPPLILSPSFNSTGSISAPPNLTISGTMSAASGFVWGTQGAIIDEYAAGNQIRMYTNTAGKGGWFQFPAGLTVNNSLYITGNSVLSASATDVYTTLQNSSTGGRTWHINATSSASGEGGGKLLIKDGTASATRLAIDSSGNVGIGTSNPGATLNIVAAVGSAATIGLNANGQSSNTVAIGQGWANATDNIAWIYNRANADLVIATNNVERMRITSSGNVGIGTSSPTSASLVVFRTSDGYTQDLGSSSGGIISAVYAGSALYHVGYAGATSPVTIMNYGTQSNIPVAFLTNNTERMRITSSGNVGIGTSSPTATLDVNGSLSISSMANYRSYSFSGNISSNTWYEVANRSNLSSGVWVVLVYMDTYNAGIGIYNVMYASVPFYYNNVACNETNGLSYTLPTLYGSGHAINGYAAPSVRIRATPIATSQIYIEINFGSNAFTGLDGTTVGKIISVYFRKIA